MTSQKEYKMIIAKAWKKRLIVAFNKYLSKLKSIKIPSDYYYSYHSLFGYTNLVEIR